MTTPVAPVVVTKEGKEKTIVAAVLGTILSILTVGSTFYTPDSTPGHMITAGLGLITVAGTVLGVYIVPNSKVTTAVVAVKDAAVAVDAAVVDVKNQINPPAELDDDEVQVALAKLDADEVQ